jgi:nucleotide-binding universal stress UspA family protein
MGQRAEHARRKPVRFRPHAGFIVANTLFAAIFVAVALSMFHTPSPHGLPVGIVAPATVTGQVEEALGDAAPGGFDLRVYPSAAAARTAIAHDEVDGALIASPGRLRLLVAKAGGAAPAQALTTAFSAIAVRSGQPLTVADVAPPLGSDSMGLSPFFVIMGVLFPSLAAGSASALVFRRARPAWCVAAPVVVAVVAGAAAAGVADGVSGLGHYPALAGLIALFSLAVAAPTAALGRIWPPLVAVAVLVFVVFGIPVSGGPSGLAPFGPGFLRVLHPALPLGAAASAVRGTVYFDGYGTAGPLWALAAWAAAGVAALALVTAWRRRASAVPVPGAAVPGAAVPGAAVPGALVPPRAGAAAVAGTSLVVGFDGSQPAKRALSGAARLPAARSGLLHIVYADRLIIDSDLSGFGHAEMEAAWDREAAGVAEAAADILAGTGIRYTFERRRGAPADAILSEASTLAATTGDDPVIVVGRPGHIAHNILGSVPVHLLHHSPYPVLTIA